MLLRHTHVILKSITALFIVVSCNKKNTETNLQPLMPLTGDYVEAEHLSTQLFFTVFKAITDSNVMSSGSGFIDGANVVFQTSPDYQLSVNYGAGNVPDPYNRLRSGRFDILFDADPALEQSSGTFNFSNFSIDNWLFVFDNYTVERTAASQQSNTWSVSSGTGNFEARDTTLKIGYSSNHIFSWTKVGHSSDFSSQLDEIMVVGESSGSSTLDESFRASDCNYILNYSCPYIYSGQTSFQTSFDRIRSGILSFDKLDNCFTVEGDTTDNLCSDIYFYSFEGLCMFQHINPPGD